MTESQAPRTNASFDAEGADIYSTLYHSTPAMMHSIDSEGRIVSVSDYWCEYLGYERSEVLGKKSIDFLTEQSRNYAINYAFPQYLQAGWCRDVPYDFVKSNGEEVNVLLSATSVKDETGKIIRSMAVLVDVSEQRRAEAHTGRKLLQLERLTTLATGLNRIFNEAPDDEVYNGIARLIGGVFASQYAGIGIVNDAGLVDCEVIDFNRLSHPVRFEMSESQPESSAPFWGKLLHGRRNVVDGEGVMLPACTSKTLNGLGASLSHLGKLVGMVFVLNPDDQFSGDEFDLMERLLFLLSPVIRTREELQRQRVRRREAEKRMRVQQTALEHSSRVNVMGEMAGGLAHEINQPLTAIANFLDVSKQAILSNETDHQLQATQLIDKAEEQVFRAASIVKSVRSFISKSEPSRENFDLNELIQETIELLKADVRFEQINVDFQPAENSLVVRADRLQIQQVLVNLLQNAFDAVEKSAEKRITIESGNGKSDNCMVVIEDDGVGFGAIDASQLFESMFTTKSTGLGMGLNICRTIVESHGGSIEAASREPHGARFTFVIPLRKP